MSEAVSVASDIESQPVREAVAAWLDTAGGFGPLDGPLEGAELFLLEAGEDFAVAEEKIRACLIVNPGLSIFVFSGRRDGETVLAAMRAGAREFLTLPADEGEFFEALSRFSSRRGGQGRGGADRHGVVAAVIGAKGGVGSTTIAVNLAAFFQRAQPSARSVILDMNIPYGEAQLFLDLKPKYSWGDAVRNLTRLDPAYLSGIVAPHQSGLALLAPPSKLDDIQYATPESIGAVVSLLAKLYDLVVVDLGVYLDEVSLAVMEAADVIHLVAVQHLACLANVRRFVENLSQAGAGRLEKVRLVVNRYLADSDLSVADMEQASGLKCEYRVPNDYPATMGAINQGRVLAEHAPKSEVAKTLAVMAAALAPAAQKKGKGGKLFAFKWFSKG